MKKSICIFLAFINLLFVVGIADTDSLTINAKVVSETNDETNLVERGIHVTGTVPNFYKNQIITLIIERPTQNEGMSPFELYATVEQTFVKSDGTYEFVIPFHEESGDYKIKVYTDTADNPVSYIISYDSISKINEFIETINNHAYSADSLLDEILSFAKTLGLDDTIFAILPKEKQLKICSKILTEVSEFKFESIKKAFDDYTVFDGLSRNKDIALAKSILDYYEPYFQIKGESLYETFLEFNKTLKDEALQYLINKTYVDAKDVKKDFLDSIFITDIKNLSFYTKLDEIIIRNKDYLKLPSINSYLKYSTDNKNLVLEYIMKNKNKIVNLVDFVSLFEYGVNHLSELSQPDAPGKGTSSGGGGSMQVGIDRSLTESNTLEDLGDSYFSDINDVKWAYTSISTLYNKGIITGREYGKFYPNEFVTRAEFIKMLVSSLSMLNEKATCKFNDVNLSDWHYVYIASGYSYGIITGIGNSEFGVNYNVSREDAATLIYRAIVYLEKHENVNSDEVNYMDSSNISRYAKNGVIALSSYNIIKGYEDNLFKPKNNLTRAEAAQIIYNTLNYVSSN